MRTLQYLVGAAFVLAMAATSPAQAQIVGSVHDLSAIGEEVCVYCHTPHNGDVTTPMADAPLWNRTMLVTTFTMYDSPTRDMLIAADPQGVSLACLSCHDGVTAYNSIIRGTASNIGTMGAPFAVGADGLGNDHPISITYDPAADLQVGFNTLASVVGAGLTMYNNGGPTDDQVECATCHNPHDVTNGSFLRIANTASALCTTCHNK